MSCASVQYTGSRAMPVYRTRLCGCSILCRRWKHWPTLCPLSRAFCRLVKTCGHSGMRYYTQTKVHLSDQCSRFFFFFNSSFDLQVYCQVIKQTNHVPQPNSPANRAHWHLLTCMSCTFLPSRAILRYLRFHLKRYVCQCFK